MIKTKNSIHTQKRKGRHVIGKGLQTNPRIEYRKKNKTNYKNLKARNRTMKKVVKKIDKLDFRNSDRNHRN